MKYSSRLDRNGFSCERNNPDNTRQERTGFTTNRTNNFPEQRGKFHRLFERRNSISGRTGYGNQRNDENYSDQRETAPERRGKFPFAEIRLKLGMPLKVGISLIMMKIMDNEPEAFPINIEVNSSSSK